MRDREVVEKGHRRSYRGLRRVSTKGANHLMSMSREQIGKRVRILPREGFQPGMVSISDGRCFMSISKADSLAKT